MSGIQSKLGTVNSTKRHKIFNTGVCAYCGSSHIRTASTPRPFRYIKCGICGKTSKTIEVHITGPGWPNAVQRRRQRFAS